MARARFAVFFVACFAAVSCSCGSAALGPDNSSARGTNATASSTPESAQDAAPPAEKTAGFEGARTFQDAANLVAMGPRQSGTEGIRKAQDYIHGQLQKAGCAFEDDDFHASTPAGEVGMKNIVVKIPGQGKGILLLLGHYDTKRMDNFVGANDGASSTALMLELARALSKQRGPNAVWITFLDGEEAFVDWNQDNDNTYGSRELAAKMAMSGDLKRVKAVLLGDMIGAKNLRIERDSNSTKWLTDMVWSTAQRLGYGNVFVEQENAIDDDHQPFLRRGVPAVDVIDFIGYQQYWHTPADTLDKISARSLAISGHVFVETISELQKKFH